MFESAPEFRTVADLVVERIAVHTDHLFGVGGANIEDLYDSLHRHPTLTGIIAKHEYGAATMADGYARATTRLGVVAATSGGGAMNLLAALAESFDSRVPVLALVGQPPTALEGRGAFQDTGGLPGRLDAARIFASVSRYCAKITRPQDICDELDHAIEVALSGGPAVLLLPKDIQAAPSAMPAEAKKAQPRIDRGGPVAAGSSGSPLLPHWDPTPPSGRGRGAPSIAESPPENGFAARQLGGGSALPRGVLETLAEVPAGAPVAIIAGPEVGTADARVELAAVARALEAAVLVTPDAKDAFPNRDPRFAGVVGVMGHPHAPELVAEVQLCLLVGTPLPLTARAGLDTALAACPRVVHLGAEQPFVPVHAEARGPLATLLNELAALASGVAGKARHRSVSAATVDEEPVPISTAAPGSIGARSDRGVLPELMAPPASGPGVRYRPAVAALEAALEPGTDVIADAGNTGAAVVHYLRVPEDGRFLIALGMGGMGYSFGAGIGCALGRGRRAMVVAGDGAYFMHGHEVHTAVEYQVPVTFVVFNNNAHAMCVTREQVFYSGEYSFNRFRAAEIGAGVAAMFPGLPTWTARTLTEFEHALEKARATPGPAFIELRCDPDEIPPFAPFLKEPVA
ncbi:thiamine pyrophosphate-binding protein [Nocardia aurantiaca]|uniref:thiamine pyrophosphate-binding protein n=1 Tax=Nocardia aurantiaca TaxID=2675850 RepID=UPI0038994B2E